MGEELKAANSYREADRFKVVVFDCDGVIFDSRDANIAFYNQVIEHFGRYPMTEDEMNYIHKATMEDAIERLFQGNPRINEILEYCKEIDLSPYMKMTRIEPDLKEVLSKIRKRYRTAIATNRGRDIHVSLKHFSLEGAFDMVVSALDVSRPKPHPEAIKRIIEHFCCKPREVIFIGDSDVDWETSKRAGVFFVAYRNDHIQGHYHIHKLSELLEYLEII